MRQFAIESEESFAFVRPSRARPRHQAALLAPAADPTVHGRHARLHLGSDSPGGHALVPHLNDCAALV